MTKYPWTVKAGTLLSQAVNALIFGGHPDQALSSRAHVETTRFWRFIRWAADWLFGQGHCQKAYEADVKFGYDIIDQQVK